MTSGTKKGKENRLFPPTNENISVEIDVFILSEGCAISWQWTERIYTRRW